MNNDSFINQDITLHNRKELTISNIKKINALNNVLVDLETGYGKLIIEGKDLDMLSLDNDKGIIVLKGTIDKIEYLENEIARLIKKLISKIKKQV